METDLTFNSQSTSSQFSRADNRLHDSSIVFDGLMVSKWSREVFEDMRKGGLTAANCTVSIWEDFNETIENIISMKSMIAENSDLLCLVRKTSDIKSAKAAGKTGVILGFQNSHAFEDNIGYVQVFKELGVGIAQLAYNTQNLIGTGCYERDGGLSGYGREVIAAMNDAGILVDLSHVGSATSEEAILASKEPVCYSHTAPAALKMHPRNKTDQQLRFIADRGGFVGVTMFAPFLKNGIESTVDDYVEAIDHVVNLIGEDSVGIGTDFTQGYDKGFFDWITRDKGIYRRLTDFGPVLNPDGIREIRDLPNLTYAMERAGWPESKIRKIIGENWVRLLKDVWKE